MCIACDDGNERELRRAIIHEKSKQHQRYVDAQRHLSSVKDFETPTTTEDTLPFVRVHDSEAQVPQYMRQMATLEQLMEGADCASGPSTEYQRPTAQQVYVDHDATRRRLEEQSRQEAYDDLLGDWNEYLMDPKNEELVRPSGREMVEQTINRLLDGAPGIWDEESDNDGEDERSDAETENSSSEEGAESNGPNQDIDGGLYNTSIFLVI